MANNILKRVITSFAIVFAVWGITFLLPSWAFCLLVVLFIGFALNEFFSIVESKGLFVYKYFGIVAGITLPIVIYLHLGEGHANLEPFFIIIACLFTFVLQLVRKDGAKDHLTSIAVTLFALFYISWFFSFFIKIKYLPDGAKLVSFLIVVTKTGDIGAYFIGKKFGKSPLIPRISPLKTKEGAIGGLVFSVAFAALCKDFLADFSYPHVLLLGFLLAIIGQVGDLAESLFKRDFYVKDSGGNLPGLGGVLDLVDSLLFTAPIFYFYLKILSFPL
ncbi:MAG: phosphatidate cytidylyltransferase [Candidatus Omnitrophica bacterium]|nr:phosphatidate cytidylyltransferase [Candidatus Omnitrophota bacterium]